MVFLLELGIGLWMEARRDIAPIDWIDREPLGAHYDWNAGQSVAHSDARELAAALGRYVADPHGSERALSIAKKFEEAGISVTAPSLATNL